MKKYLLFLIIPVLLIGCENDDNSIKIGIILPLTGEVATYGESVKEGIDLAFEGFEEQELQFSLLYEDSQAEKVTAINGLESLFLKGVHIFIGDATSTVTYEIGPRIQSRGDILIVPIATGDKIREIGDKVFMISPRNEKQTFKIIEYIKEKEGVESVGCLFKQNDYGVNIATTFFDSIPDAYSQAYQEGQNDFRTLLLRFKTKGIKTIFVPGNYEETSLILKQAKELSYNPTFIGTDGCYSPKLISQAGQASDGFLLTMMPIDYNSALYVEFDTLFRNKYDKEPDIFAAYGYETSKVILQAILNSSSSDPSTLSEYIGQNEFESLTGVLSFDASGEALRQYQIFQVKDGGFIPFSK